MSTGIKATSNYTVCTHIYIFSIVHMSYKTRKTDLACSLCDLVKHSHVGLKIYLHSRKITFNVWRFNEVAI